MNQTEAKALWLYMGEIWPNYRLPASELEMRTREQVWGDLLGDVDAGIVRAVIAEMAGAGREFAPSPGQIRAEADKITMAAKGLAPPDPDEAWAEVRQAVGVPAMRDNPEWSHRAVSQAVEAMGWRQFRNSETEAEGTWRAHFLRFYASAAARWRQDRGMGPPEVTAAAVRELAAKFRAPELTP